MKTFHFETPKRCPKKEWVQCRVVVVKVHTHTASTVTSPLFGESFHFLGLYLVAQPSLESRNS